jgi:hypothetical protein
MQEARKIRKSKVLEFCKRHSNLIVFLALFVFWFSILMVSGALMSGYHLTDDHAILVIDSQIKQHNQSIWEIAWNWMSGDMKSGRFRPLYFLIYTYETGIFGTNIFLWSVLTGFLSAFTSFFLFLFSKKIDNTSFEAIIFVLITLLGQQTAVWWRLGPQETFGIFLLSLCLLFMVFGICQQKKKKLYDILFLLFAVLTSLMKESFVLLLPALAVLRYYLTLHLNNLPAKKAIRSNFLFFFILITIFLAEIFYINSFIGIGGTSYAGIKTLNPFATFFVFRTLLSFGHYNLIFLLVFFLAIIYKSENKQELILKFKAALNALWIPVLILFLVIGPQALLHTESGVNIDRYVLPSTLFLALFSTQLYKYLRSIKMQFWIYCSIIALTFFLLAPQLEIALLNAKAFAQSGQTTQKLFSYVEENTNQNSNILIVYNSEIDGEWSGSIKTYLNIMLKRRNIFDFPINANTGKIYDACDLNSNCFSNIEDKPKINAAIIFPDIEEQFIADSMESLYLSDYSRKKAAEFVLYFKN